MRVLALDLSLTATGFVLVDREAVSRDERVILHRGTIKTGQRRGSEHDFDWNRRRLRHFTVSLGTEILRYTPDVLVTEVSSSVFKYRSSAKNQARYGPGTQFRAGVGLGRALGWLDSVLIQLDDPPHAVPMETQEVKFRITGNRGADKTAVAEFLKRIYGWDVDGWPDAETDALAVAQAYIQGLEQFERTMHWTPEQREAVAQALSRPGRRKAALPARDCATLGAGGAEMTVAAKGKKCKTCGKTHSGKCS